MRQAAGLYLTDHDTGRMNLQRQNLKLGYVSKWNVCVRSLSQDLSMCRVSALIRRHGVRTRYTWQIDGFRRKRAIHGASKDMPNCHRSQIIVRRITPGQSLSPQRWMRHSPTDSTRGRIIYR